jgi:hypothetical protein
MKAQTHEQGSCVGAIGVVLFLFWDGTGEASAVLFDL